MLLESSLTFQANEISLLHFRMPYFQINNGTLPSSTSQHLCGQLNDLSQKVFQSSGRSVTVKFVSDGSVTHSGFEITWKIITGEHFLSRV